MESRVIYAYIGESASVGLYRYGPTTANSLQQVCCCGSGRQDISIDCCTAHSSANAGSATFNTLSAYVESSTDLCGCNLQRKKQMAISLNVAYPVGLLNCQTGVRGTQVQRMKFSRNITFPRLFDHIPDLSLTYL